MTSLFKLQADAMQELKETIQNDVKENIENFSDFDDLESYLENMDLNDKAWEIADNWVPVYNSDIIEIFSNDGFEVNSNYIEMQNEIGVNNGDDVDILDRIKQGIFWAIYRDLYDNINQIKAEILENYEQYEFEQDEETAEA